MTAVSFKCWTPAVQCKKSDNIISSEFSGLKIFTPSYEKEPHICMDQLMANEYQRIWLIERDEWARKTFVSKNGKTYMRKNNSSNTIIEKGKDNGKLNGKKTESRKQLRGGKSSKKLENQ